LTLSLLSLGEYSLSFFAQFFLLFTFVKSSVVFFVFFTPLYLFFLANIFGTMSSLLYFLNLFIALSFLLIKDFKINFLNLFMVSISFGIGLFFYSALDNFRYELYLESHIKDKIYPFFLDIVFGITLLHLIIMVNIGIIKQKYF
jgi:hypothetical protein